MNALSHVPEFLPQVRFYWEDTDVLFYSTSALHLFSKKLKALKRVIQILGKEKLGVFQNEQRRLTLLYVIGRKNTLENPTEENMWR